MRVRKKGGAEEVGARGKNGLDIPVGYLPDKDNANTHFSDTDSVIFIFGTDTGNTRIMQLRIRFGYGTRTTRIFGSDTGTRFFA